MAAAIGQATASLHCGRVSAAFGRVWGAFDINIRQKWSEVWPLLSRLPPDNVKLLDAGCGTGQWSLELAARRPGWTITGIDSNPVVLKAAEQARRTLGLGNVEFHKADFQTYVQAPLVDVVLSVASAHYLCEGGRAEMLFRTFRSWLAPTGMLILYGPRDPVEAPTLGHLTKATWKWGFDRGQLEDWAREADFMVSQVRPCLGRYALLAKKLSDQPEGSIPRRALAYPFQVGFDRLDRWMPGDRDRKSVAYLLVAHPRRSGDPES